MFHWFKQRKAPMTDQPPAYLARRAAAGVSDDLTSGLGVSAPPYISIMGGRFTLIDAAGNKIPVQTFDPKIGLYVDVIIIAINKEISRIYYAEPFNPGATEFKPPDCWSDNGV